MNDKLSPLRDAIFYRHRQRYTSEMIQLWLIETHQLMVCTRAIDRCVRKSMENISSYSRVAPCGEYDYYRAQINARRQAREYKQTLSRSLGLIEHYRNEHKYTAREIQAYLKSVGTITSLSSVHRALRRINEKNKIPSTER